VLKFLAEPEISGPLLCRRLTRPSLIPPPPILISSFHKINLNPLNAELNPVCCLLALLRAQHFLHVSRIRVKSLTLRLLMSYTGCPRRKGQNFGRVFLMLKYTDITKTTYIQSWTVTEIMAREKCDLLADLRTVPCQLTAFRMSVLDCRVRLQKYRWRCSSKLPPCWWCSTRCSCVVNSW